MIKRTIGRGTMEVSLSSHEDAMNRLTDIAHELEVMLPRAVRVNGTD